MTNTADLVQRCKFEAWWERSQNNGNPPRFGWEHWREGGGYKVGDDDSEFYGMWSVWIAAVADTIEVLEKSVSSDVTRIKAAGVEEFAAYISLYSTDAKHHALVFAKQLRGNVSK